MLDRIVNLLAVVAGILLCALIAPISVDVLARNLKLFPIRWSLEVAELMLYGITFFGAPWVLKTGGHISIDLLVGRLPPRLAQGLARLTNVIGAIVSAILLYYWIQVVLRFMEQKQEAYGALIFPKWWVYAPTLPTFFLMLLIFLRWSLWPSTLAETARRDSDGF